VAPVAALTLAVCVAVAAAAAVVMVLFGQAVAERAGVGELPVHTGGVRALALLQQLRGGRVGEGAAAPRTVLVGLGALRLEAGILPREMCAGRQEHALQEADVSHS